jgi:hypothetical protein
VTARTPAGTVIGTPLIAPGAAIGGKAKTSPTLVLESWTMHAPEAPSPAAEGKVTAMAKYMATAASVALPPPSRMSRPISAARLSSAATAANLPPVISALSGCFRAICPVGLAVLFTWSLSVSLPPQPASKNTAISARLRN